MGSPGIVDLKVYQGDSFELFFRLRNQVWDDATSSWIPGSYWNLTGYTVRSQIREKKDSPEVTTEFACSLGDQATTPGSVICVLSPAQTALLTKPAYVYDLQVSNGPNNVTTYLAGQVLVTAEVTR